MASSPQGSRHVVAAGAVVTRAGGEVLLVHRPKYDDWSFPKGKLDPGEQPPGAAVREVAEETGLRIRLQMPLQTQQYPVRTGTKEVRYWAGQVHEGDDDVSGYTRGNEIDEVAWVAVDKAEETLTYPYDRATLLEALALPRKSRTLVVLRHAVAVPRKQWRDQDDRTRPLAEEGQRQAEALVATLQAWAPDRVISSTSTRCAQTVQPLLEHRAAAGAPVPAQFTAELSEEKATAKKVRAVVRAALDQRGVTVLCTHRPVLGAVLTALNIPAPALAPGAALVVHHRKGDLLSSELIPAPEV